MTHPLAPHAHEVALRDKSTGEEFARSSVDAREFVTMHPDRYEYVLPGSGAPLAAPAPDVPKVAPPAVDYEEALEALGYAQLQEMARRAGLQNINLKKPAMIAALLPHLEGGTLSLTTPAQVLGIGPAPTP